MVYSKSGKNNVLLIGFISGILVLVICLFLIVPLITSVNIDSNLSVLLIVVSLCFIAGILLNFLGWYRNNSKLAFIAVIFYIIPLINEVYYIIPTLALCIIGSFMVKKNKTGFYFA